MTPHDKNEEQDLAHHWDPLDPEVKKQFAISVFLRKRHKLFSCPSFLISTNREAPVTRAWGRSAGASRSVLGGPFPREGRSKLGAKCHAGNSYRYDAPPEAG